MDTTRSKKLHIGILASPGMGHLLPVLVLGNRLSTEFNVKVTVLAITEVPTVQNLGLEAELADFDVLQIPPVDISHLIDANTKLSTRIRIMVSEALPGLRSAISGMKDLPEILICDLFCTKAFPVANEFNMRKYLYVATNAWYTALQAYTPVLHKQIDGQYVDHTQPLKIPGCKSVRPEEVNDAMLDRNDPRYEGYLQAATDFGLADGILVNTWEDLEPVTLEAFRENESLRKVLCDTAVYPIGPLTRRPRESDGIDDRSLMMMEWLDKQPSESVLFVSFGSGGTLSAQQLTELAFGLELSQQRFIWVVRPPARMANGSFFTVTQGDEPLDYYYLPQGFLTRTKNTGWIKVVDRKEIEEMVRFIMESEEGMVIRDRVKQLKVNGEGAISKGGSSYNSMNDFLKDAHMRLIKSLSV
ncbi:OLC1v1005972C1 [Oldenlandia corymbosa var. corymbosa]|uniref:OLC1v1005972C1 n=1 Tax=Oldenlandia corymbosa var. corymbosa TaxID=529605 RepID=A0AAV1DIJ9_OLDCO|nr:OLC1v1005972C1 [Oldenlandia corymbosa var. corymbosa]